MAICNSRTGMKSLNTSSYEAVFGQRYHPVLRCTVAEMRDCSSIFQRLKLSPDERLAKYVKDHDIVDIDDSDGHGHNLQKIKELSNDVDDSDESEGDDINDDTFPDCEKEDKILCQEITTEVTDVNGTIDITFDETIQQWRYPSSNWATF